MLGHGAISESAISALPEAGTVAATVFEDSWHQPFSEPTRFRLAPAAAAALIALTSFTISPWALTKAEASTVDRFQRELSEPVRFAPRLATAQQQFFAFQDRFPFDETPAPSWIQPLSGPVRFPPRLATASQPFFATDVNALTRPELVTADRWAPPFSEPVRFAPRLPAHAQQFRAQIETVLFPEAITSDRWMPPLAEPVRLEVRPGPLAAQESTFAVVYDYRGLTQGEAITADRWTQPLSEIVRFRPALPAHAQQFFAFQDRAPFAERPTADRWVQPLSEIVRFRPALLTDAQQFFAFQDRFPFDVSPLPGWLPPLSEPVRFAPRLPAHAQQFEAIDAYALTRQENVTADRWAQPLSEIVRFSPALPLSAQQFLAIDVHAMAQPESVTADRWVPPLAEPIRFPPALPAFLQWFGGYPYLNWNTAIAFSATLVGEADIQMLPTTTKLAILTDDDAFHVYQGIARPRVVTGRPD